MNCMPLGCFLHFNFILYCCHLFVRIFTEGTRREFSELQKKKPRAQSPATSLRSNTPTGTDHSCVSDFKLRLSDSEKK